MSIKAKAAWAIVFFSGAMLLVGCGTAKGLATGVGAGVGATAQGVAEDTKGVWHGIQAADNWIRKNLW